MLENFISNITRAYLAYQLYKYGNQKHIVQYEVDCDLVSRSVRKAHKSMKA